MSTASIKDWLRKIPDDRHQYTHHRRPHKRQRRQHPVTPDPSEDCAFAMPPRRGSPFKRQTPATNEEQPEDERTPRPKRLDPRGIDFQDLVLFENKPQGLEELLDAIELIMEGKGIVSTSQQEELTKASKLSKDFKWAGRGGDYFSDDRDSIGHTPSPDAVSRVLAAAAECSSNSHPEVNWNMEVHQPVLSMALRPSNQGLHSHLVNFMGSTQASLIPDYTNSSILKKIDFSIYIKPANDLERAAPDDSPKDVIGRCRNDLPENVFNFTDSTPLAQRPIALSIETKKPSAGFDGAKLQLGVWQNAHWTFLRHLALVASRNKVAAEKKSAEKKSAEAVAELVAIEQQLMETEQEQMETEQESIAAEQRPYKLPSFIPGIIIQGHLWHLIITTPEGRRTVVWQSVGIGNTQSTKGIYQIVCVLHLLRKWVETTYWPLIWEMVSTGWPKPPES
ncbi:hypothetical protein BKA59DRAFT_539321 [Fusarium tricinctum]|uniref:PD-(D/E)XK nuclease-like domain-containing protein n=1 Tax=Fusarium tricinctum TaxID=61284 RepID=A0A8K0S864_9HYPO|nr:hypothetical protein BKA59DRAFT_539321 [Fusarium tricinctum]